MKLKPQNCSAEQPSEHLLKTQYVRDQDVNGRAVRLVRADDGGALRTFSGGRSHENGWYTSRKARRLLHWEGMAQFDFLNRAEVEFSVLRMASESVRFEFVSGGKVQIYTIDVELVAPDGRRTFVEIKRDKRDLKDPDYRAKLAEVRDICNEQGIAFRVIFRHEIWESLMHRRNVALFVSRRFASVTPEHLRRLDEHGRQYGADATYGSLAHALEPNSPRIGEAVLQALTVARRVNIDLTRPLFDATPVTIH